MVLSCNKETAHKLPSSTYGIRISIFHLPQTLMWHTKLVISIPNKIYALIKHNRGIPISIQTPHFGPPWRVNMCTIHSVVYLCDHSKIVEIEFCETGKNFYHIPCITLAQTWKYHSAPTRCLSCARERQEKGRRHDRKGHEYCCSWHRDRWGYALK